MSSQENVEIVRRGFERFLATGDPVPYPEIIDPEFVWDMSTFHGWPEKKLYPGPDGVREFMAAWMEAWDDWELDVEEYLEAGDQIVVVLSQRARSRGSGLPVEMHFSQVWTLRDGKQVRMQMYASREEGLRAAGLDSGEQKD